jgi:hypothetical protein
MPGAEVQLAMDAAALGEVPRLIFSGCGCSGEAIDPGAKARCLAMSIG